MSLRGLLGQGRGERDGIATSLRFSLEVREKHVAVLVNAVGPISSDKHVSVPAVRGLTGRVLLEYIGHVGSIPVDAMLGLRQVEGTKDLETDFFGGLVGVLDAGFLPHQATLAVWGRPIMAKTSMPLLYRRAISPRGSLATLSSLDLPYRPTTPDISEIPRLTQLFLKL